MFKHHKFKNFKMSAPRAENTMMFEYILRGKFTLVNDGVYTYRNYPYRSKLEHLYSQFLASNSHLRPEVVPGEFLRMT